MAGKPIPLSKFLDGATVGGGAEDDLPSAPQPAAGEREGTKYVVEWNGSGPLPLPPDVARAAENKTTFTATNTLHKAAPATVEEFKAKVSDVVREYFDSTDVMEVIRQLEELRTPRQHAIVVTRAITLSLERSDREREMVAVLIASLHARRVVSSTQVFDAFIALLERAGDLMLDCPAADGMLAHFLADAVLDGCLTPTFILEPPPLSMKLSAEEKALADRILANAAERLQRGTNVAAPSQQQSLSVPLEEVKACIDSLVVEYLQAEDAGEVARRLREGHVVTPLRHELVKRGVRVALQRGPQECEAISRLVSALYGSALPAAEVTRGFEALLAEADDLAIDMPDTPRLLGNFIARAVSDEVVPVSFVDQALRTHPRDEGPAHSALKRAKSLLAMSHRSHRMARVWGPAALAAKASVEEIKVMFGDIVDELFLSLDEEEARRALAELNVASYHFEFVKKLLRRAVEESDSERRLAVGVLKRLLADPAVITPDAVSLGFDRVQEGMEDLRLDCPDAGRLLADMRASAAREGMLPS